MASLCVRADLRGKREERLVVAAGCGQLHAAVRAGDGDRGHASQAERRRVAQQARAGLAVVGAGGEARNGNRWQQNELVRGEELVHARAKSCVALAQCGDFIGSEAGAPLEAVADGRLEAIEVAGVQLRSLRRLEGREDFDGIRPPVRVDGSTFQSKILQSSRMTPRKPATTSGSQS